MIFTSLEFFVFLPIALLVFAVVGARWRWTWLLVASWVFYGAGHPVYLVYLGSVTITAIVLGWGIERAAGGTRAALLTAGILGLAGSLIAFKYFDFAAGEIEKLIAATLPGGSVSVPRLGITSPAGYSFIAFSALSYLIDVYRRSVPGEQRAVNVALYLAFFPKLLAGPIERAPAFFSQLGNRSSLGSADIVLASQLIGWGLFKKVVIADNLAPLVDRNFAIAAFTAPLELLASVYFFAFQIYCDFSGYTDIAIGVALLFGIRLMDNFRRPYLSVSTAEFWGERWHISLAHWFRDYLYIPLGGSRAGPLRHYFNVMLVFLVSGLWHAGLGYGVGGSFLIWGALNGTYQWVGLATRGLWRRLGEGIPAVRGSTWFAILRILLTFHLIAFAWIFFRAKSIADAFTVIRKIAANLAEIPGLILRYPFTAEHAMGASLIALLLVVEVLDQRRPIAQRMAAAPVPVRWGIYYLVIFGLLILGRWQAKEFIYMRF